MSELPVDITDALARVNSGLERDEELAQHAAPPLWGGEWQAQHPVVRIADDTDATINGPLPVLGHVARQDPARVLRQVGAFRDILSAVDGLRANGFLGATRIADDITIALDSIYDDFDAD